MKQLAIKAENISKQYRIGEVGTGTLSHDLNRLWYKLRGKEDPYLRIGEANDRATKGESNYVWSLRDINFEIEQGDAVGIIGRNGAGKSTLLKLLSKVTKPTTGNFKVNGRIASLLEVGTGFNPEMTGRENIYLNGAILGMRRHEITRKLDEIIDFSGVERYIDTPVKRYSSGMYVRLAFAVAAHLESEILIVDEVLAVGDAEFQKKCLGKMGDVSKGEGRTVLFVSHNMAAISSLCNKGIYLKNGILIESGNVSKIVSTYMQDSSKINGEVCEGEFGDENIRITSTKIVAVDVVNGFHTNTDLIVEVHGEVLKPIFGLVLGFNLWSQFDYEIAYVLHDDVASEVTTTAIGVFVKKFRIPANTLAEGNYSLQFDIGIHNNKRIINDECNLSFSLVNINGIGRKYLIGNQRGKSSLIRADWSI
ncbi:polysaccharide ABC transporter ATP-binding protein [Flavobacterium sp.]|jgi:lipopolysaccharide transport system ATP-binding protein|uniref:polysaccharide ABC transporter ATP-binding protein n=1 Tax=Flavobacterium sp. TaxID=239 RepID=UPI0037BFDF43